MTTMITLSKGGTAERQVDVDEIRIPDLWHPAMWLKEHQPELTGEPNIMEFMATGEMRRPLAWEMVLETWHLCNDLLRYIKEVKQ